MKKKNRRAKEARADTPVKELTEKETLVHYNSVLAEDLNSKMQLVLECVQAMTQRFESVESRLDSIENRLSIVGQVVQANSQRLSTVEHALRALKEDMLDMERRICSKINRIAERCESHECRLTTLEAHQ